jgi:hypothetical protein
VSDQPSAAWRSFKAALRFIIAVFLTIARFRMLSILPAFDRFLKEAAILGRILAGYGELEYDLATAMGSALNDDDLAFRLLFRNRGEEQRISIGDIILRPICEKWKLRVLGNDATCFFVVQDYAQSVRALSLVRWRGRWLVFLQY